ncbi:uncharacterized protein MELLADRAFT_47943 [Melampsora larici-populina 98AG31]|uniref:Quinate transporter n=1 Tax=Melampsora larici-populina (strain 98AG31 / pathotype 3-4-7) TaxID=747676 RepID=F4RI23_MELLP|nr:uncharacterized protein MELLADRAFT_47943 [Melampsora larici-populina 98AG31]EGG07923.1 hypothetical protein MELLADRAFT_47943 [Melampsora larici-populina 98AG31]
MMIGYDSAFIGGTIALPSFKADFGLDRITQDQFNLISANIVSFYQMGCFLGALFAYPLGHFYGRRKSLLISVLIFLIGAIFMTISNRSNGLSLIYVGRVFTGFGIGIVSSITPIYIAEISIPSIRGRLIGLYELGWQIGGIIGFWINYGVSQNPRIKSQQQYLIPFAIQLLPAGICLIGLISYLKESPRWLLSRGRKDEALNSLCWIRNSIQDDPLIQNEFSIMESSLEKQNEQLGNSFWAPFEKLLFHRPLLTRLMIAGSLFIFQNGTGINAINYYSPTVFASIGVTGTSSALLSTGVFGAIKTIATLFWLFFLADAIDRTTMLMFGAFFGGLMMYGLGAYIAIVKPTENPSLDGLRPSGKGALAMFYLWTVFYSPTWNPTPWVWAAEAFPMHVRTLSQSFVASSNWLFNFLIARFTPQMFTSMGYGVYIFFASFMMISIPFVWFIVPELRGIPLEMIDEVFENWNPRKGKRFNQTSFQLVQHSSLKIDQIQQIDHDQD